MILIVKATQLWRKMNLFSHSRLKIIDLDKTIKSIKHVLKLKKDEKFMSKLSNQYKDEHIEIHTSSLTISISKKTYDDLPF